MQWNSLSEFLNMGGYALYVWGSYSACALCIALEVFSTRQRFAAARTRMSDETSP